MVSHETPVNSVSPAANVISNTSVPPVNPSSLDAALPAIAPIIPPGASGKVALRLCKRKYSMPLLAMSSTKKPMPITTYERRSVSGTLSMRRNPQPTSAAQNNTHQYADTPYRYSSKSARYAPTMPPALRMSATRKLCDQPGSPLW